MILQYLFIALRGNNPFTIIKAQQLFAKYGCKVSLNKLEAHYIVSKETNSWDEFIDAAKIIFERDEQMNFEKLCALHMAGHITKIKNGKRLDEIEKEIAIRYEQEIREKGLEGYNKTKVQKLIKWALKLMMKNKEKQVKIEEAIKRYSLSEIDVAYIKEYYGHIFEKE
ncbi:MAG: hypothetical protein ABH952_05045 [Candidatus Omnitrophota bacterium]